MHRGSTSPCNLLSEIPRERSWSHVCPTRPNSQSSLFFTFATTDVLKLGIQLAHCQFSFGKGSLRRRCVIFPFVHRSHISAMYFHHWTWRKDGECKFAHETEEEPFIKWDLHAKVGICTSYRYKVEGLLLRRWCVIFTFRQWGWFLQCYLPPKFLTRW